MPLLLFVIFILTVMCLALTFASGDLEEMLMCPHCSSDMIIEVNVGHRSKGSAVSTPTGSFKEPMATSSANPSPWKRTESPR